MPAARWVLFMLAAACWLWAAEVSASFVSPAASSARSAPDDDESGLFNVRRFGAKGDGAADDTAAVQRAIDAAAASAIVVTVPGVHDAVVSRATVFFPHGRYRLTRTLHLPARPPDLMGFGRPLLEMRDNTSDLAFGAEVWRWRARGLTFVGGRNQLHVGNNNTDKGQILIDDCTFVASAGAAIRLLEPSYENWPAAVGMHPGRRGSPKHDLVKFSGSFSTHVAVSRCVFQGCSQVLVNWADWTTVDKSWVTTSETQPLDSAVFENHDRLFLSDILGVPRESGHSAAARQRWVDNYVYRSAQGRVGIRQFRFGGEGSGLGGVFNFAPFACQLVQSSFSHLDLCARIPHTATAVPPNVSLSMSAITIEDSQLDTHQNILRLEEVPAHVEVSGNELRDGSGAGILVFNVSSSINLTGPVFSELLARAAQGRRWLSYSIGKSNWNGPTLSGGVLPGPLRPFEF